MMTYESLFSDYAKRWEEAMMKQRDIFDEALNQISRFRSQLIQEEQISQKMTRTQSAQ